MCMIVLVSYILNLSIFGFPSVILVLWLSPVAYYVMFHVEFI